jgi:hypothetical protein
MNPASWSRLRGFTLLELLVQVPVPQKVPVPNPGTEQAPIPQQLPAPGAM